MAISPAKPPTRQLGNKNFWMKADLALKYRPVIRKKDSQAKTSMESNSNGAFIGVSGSVG